MRSYRKVVRFALNSRGRTIAWQNGYGACPLKWMRIGCERARLLVASGEADDVTAQHMLRTGSVSLVMDVTVE
jgi:hypothetical protein